MNASIWTNWFGNQKCRPTRISFPKSEEDIQAIVRNSAMNGTGIRAVGSGHSLPPVVNTEGILIDLKNISGPPRIDAVAQTATIAAGTKLDALFDPLWDAGFAMKNMGELANSSIAGAVSTGAHGTGRTLQCTSASVIAGRLITADGEVLEFSKDHDPELLKAAQVSVGMLGIFSELTISIIPAYDLEERSALMSVEEAVDGWNDLIRKHRHFSFYYIATPAAAASFADQLPHLPAGSADLCYGMIMDDLDPSAPSTAKPSEHVKRDRMNRILTVEFEPNYREIEYAVPAEFGMATFVELREMLLTNHPDYSFPVNVRFVDGDDAFLSAYNGGPKVVFSVSEEPSAPYSSVLSHAEKLFQERGGLPHWGKEHALTREVTSRLYPDFNRFQKIRRELDPKGMFLNDHMRELFG